jgi:hypothetical protein
VSGKRREERHMREVEQRRDNREERVERRVDKRGDREARHVYRPL